MSIDFSKRRDKLRKLVHKAKADALLVTDFTNVTYLTGFTGDDSFLLVHDSGEALITDFRYITQLEQECPGLELFVRPVGMKMSEAVAKVVDGQRSRASSAKSAMSRVGVEGDSMSLNLRAALEEQLGDLPIVSTGGLVEQLRAVKDRFEIDAIRRAVEQAERAFGVVRASLRQDMTEREICRELEYQMRVFGAKVNSFPSIIAVGPNAALPHAGVTDARVEESEILLMDFGAKEGLYVSDLTRVLVTARLSPKLERIYGVVLAAQLAGIAAIAPGVKCSEVDAAARGVIEEAGFGKKFGHSLGHGIGLQVHEGPRLASSIDVELKPGMVVTVEPGIYVPGWGGVRIEDDILVTKNGHEVLSSLPKELDDMVVAS